MGTMDTGSALPSNTWGTYVDHILCGVCKGGEHEDKILLCDLCDKGFHMYCLKEPLTEIPQGTWLCDACAGISCRVCGLSNDASLLLICDRCDAAYHTYCTVPPTLEVPEGGWRCPSCSSDPYIATACQICKQGTDDEHMLLCDGCDRGHHLHCLDPPLLAVPDGDWFCPSCIKLRPRNRRRREQVAAALAHGSSTGRDGMSHAMLRDASGGKYPPGVTESVWNDLSIIRRIGLIVDVHTGALASPSYVPLLIEIMSDAVWKLQETCAAVLLCTYDPDVLQAVADEGSACVLGILSLAMSEFSTRDTWSAFKVVIYMTRLLLHLPMALHHYQSPTVKLLLGGAFMPASSAQQRINDARPELFSYIDKICNLLQQRTGGAEISAPAASVQQAQAPTTTTTTTTTSSRSRSSTTAGAPKAAASKPSVIRIPAPTPAEAAARREAEAKKKAAADRGRRVSSRAAVAAINSHMKMEETVDAAPRQQPSALEPVCVGKGHAPVTRGMAARVPFKGHRVIMVGYGAQRANHLAKRLRGKGLSVSVRGGRNPLSFGDIQDNTHVVVDLRGREHLPVHVLSIIDPARYHLDCLIFADSSALLDHFVKGGVSRFLDETSEACRMLRGGGYVLADVAHMDDPVHTLRHMKAVADWHSNSRQQWHVLVSPASLMLLEQTDAALCAKVAALKDVAYEEADGMRLLGRAFTVDDAQPKRLLKTMAAAVTEYQRDARFFAVVSDNKDLFSQHQALVDIVAVDYMPRYWNEHGADINAVPFENIAAALDALDGGGDGDNDGGDGTDTDVAMAEAGSAAPAPPPREAIEISVGSTSAEESSAESAPTAAAAATTTDAAASSGDAFVPDSESTDSDSDMEE